MAQIGKPIREILVEPLTIPVPSREATPAPSVPQPAPPERVPA